MKWEDVVYEVVPATAPALVAVTKELQATHVNGGAILKIFRPTDVTAFDAATQEDHRGYPTILRSFLENPSIRDLVPELRIPTSPSRLPQFAQYSGFEFEGAVTHHILFGGADESSALDEEQARRISRSFVDGLLGKGRLHAVVWGTDRPWTPWFHDVAWDMTFAILQHEARQWALFCMTDTD